MTATAKTCSKCGGVKGLDFFYKDQTGRLGRTADCKKCRCEKVNHFRLANDEKVKARKRAAYLENPIPYIERARAAYKLDPKKAIDAALEWRRTNRQRFIAYTKVLKKTPAGVARTKRYQRRRVDEMRPSYVASALRMKTAEVSPELIALKREQLAIKRMACELKQATKPTGVTQ